MKSGVLSRGAVGNEPGVPMSMIHYFQRYSSLENTVTNNTLQLVARIYEHSATAASTFLTNVTGEPVEIGLEIAQQQSAKDSVPDGAIIQRSFKVLIEAKVDAPTDPDQLLRHAGAFATESQKLLLLLTKQPIGSAEGEISALIGKRYPDVVFKNVTYEAICEAAQGLFKEHETSMRALVDDYVEYCSDADLFDQSRFLLRIVPCGQSLDLNKKYGIYFQPSDRGYSRHAFIGIYADKSVQAILDVEGVFDVDIVDGRLTRVIVEGADTDRFDARLREMIEEAAVVCGWDVATGHRFFCGEILLTDFRKSSPGGVFGTRLLDLREFLSSFTGADDVAARLAGSEWS